MGDKKKGSKRGVNLAKRVGRGRRGNKKPKAVSDSEKENLYIHYESNKIM